MTKYTKTFADAMKEVRKPKVVKEDYEVSMAIGQLKTIQDRIGKIMEFLSGKSDDYNMEAWLQSKITSAEDKLNSVANYVTNNPEVNEAKEEPKEKDNSEALEKTIADLKDKLALTTQKLENEKNKVVKPEANPDAKVEQPKDLLTHAEVPNNAEAGEGDERRRGRNRRGRGRGQRGEGASDTTTSPADTPSKSATFSAV